MKNKHEVINGVAHVEVVSKGVKYIVLIDEQDIELIGNRTVTRDSKGYYRFKKDYKSVYLHKLFCEAPDGLVVDHINGVKEDNRRSQLRAVTSGVNRANTDKLSAQSGVKGVYKQPSGKYRVYFQFNKKYLSFGTYNTLEEAEKVAETKRKELYGL